MLLGEKEAMRTTLLRTITVAAFLCAAGGVLVGTANADDKDDARKALLEVFAPEVRKFPELRDFLADEKGAVLKKALDDYAARRGSGGVRGLVTIISRSRVPYLEETGLKAKLAALEAAAIKAALAKEAELVAQREALKRALLDAFAAECSELPGLAAKLTDEKGRPFQAALEINPDDPAARANLQSLDRMRNP